MSTKILMASSAVFMAALGLAATFLPQEIIAALGGGTVRTLPLLVQVLGALYLGFAMLNWMAKESLIGGIYSRPVSMGNFLHFAIAGIAMVKAVAAGERAVSILICTAIYAVFAIAFGAVVFGRVKAAK
jgi:predicted DNA repair protein MutK